MSYKIKNTALDPTKRFLHRTASKLQMEPVLAGRRLRLRTSMVISDELFEHNKPNLNLWKGWGVVDWEKVGEETRHVPTKEEVLQAGYSSEAADAIIEREKQLAELEAAKAAELESLRLKQEAETAEQARLEAEAVTRQAAEARAAAEATPTAPESPQAETTLGDTKPQPKNPSKVKK